MYVAKNCHCTCPTGLTPLAVIFRPPNVFNPNRVSSPPKNRTFPLQPKTLNATHTNIVKFSRQFFYMHPLAETTALHSQVAAPSARIAGDNALVYALFCQLPGYPTASPISHKLLDSHQILVVPVGVFLELPRPRWESHGADLNALCSSTTHISLLPGRSAATPVK